MVVRVRDRMFHRNDTKAVERRQETRRKICSARCESMCSCHCADDRRLWPRTVGRSCARRRPHLDDNCRGSRVQLYVCMQLSSQVIYIHDSRFLHSIPSILSYQCFGHDVVWYSTYTGETGLNLVHANKRVRRYFPIIYIAFRIVMILRNPSGVQSDHLTFSGRPMANRTRRSYLHICLCVSTSMCVLYIS